MKTKKPKTIKPAPVYSGEFDARLPAPLLARLQELATDAGTTVPIVVSVLLAAQFPSRQAKGSR